MKGLYEFPCEKHYGILIEEQFMSDDGYGGKYSHIRFNYEAFSKKIEWESRIEELSIRDKKVFRAFEVNPAKIQITTKVELNG